MLGVTVRLKSAIIENFKNVKYGKIDFPNNKKGYNSSILGLYGQNGSGKSALIEALGLLKNCLGGWVVPAYYTDFINVDSDCSSFEFVFDIRKGFDSEFEVSYHFCLKKESNNTLLQNTNSDNSLIPDYKSSIFNEIVSYSYEKKGSKKARMSELINTCDNNFVFTPNSKYEMIFGKDKNVKTDLLVLKKYALKNSISFIFSNELLEKFRHIFEENNNQSEVFLRHFFVLDAISSYGRMELFVIDSKSSGIISLNLLPLTFRLEENKGASAGRVGLYLEKPAAIPERYVKIAEKVIKNMNVVLSQIIPGLTITIKNLGKETLQNGEDGYKIELLSKRNGKIIPLRNESEGIKKIVSILQLLVVVYNNPSITVAIDELDAGIFEYMLGELLNIIANGGKGQLIFTSHNLRPLETLDWNFIAFTTTNENNRYIKCESLKRSNNLRSIYYRKIQLGNDGEELYDSTNNSEIAFTFREAGEKCGQEEDCFCDS